MLLLALHEKIPLTLTSSIQRHIFWLDRIRGFLDPSLLAARKEREK